MTLPWKGVVVVGAGTMGPGIAQVSAVAGIPVTLCDLQQSQLDAGLARIRAHLGQAVERGKLGPEQRDAAIGRIRTSRDADGPVSEADLVIEAVPERMELKLELFRRLDRIAPPDATLATNTSSLSVTEIAAATARPGSVVGLHFFNPVHIMKLLEVVRGAETSPATVDLALRFARMIGKEPIVVRDSPGFASSRLGVALGLEAMRMVEEGVGTPADIDRAMELGYGHPMGPLRLTDLVGLDVRLGIAESLHQRLGGTRFDPPAILRRMVKEGRLGKKSGRGFYEWDQE